MNVILLTGRVGQDAELKEFDSFEVCNFSLATVESYKNKEGEWINNTTWHNCQLRGKRATGLAPYITKGKELEIVGKQLHKKSEKDGNTRYFSTVDVSEIKLAPKKKAEGESASQPANTSTVTQNQSDDLPF